MRQHAPRIHGALTAVYALLILARPNVLTRPVGLGSDPGPRERLLVATLGVRDVCSGAFLVAARSGGEQRAAVALRAAFDAGDAVLFGRLAPTVQCRRKAALAAGAWGLAALAALAVAER